VHKYNQRGYILELNASSAKVMRKIEPAFDFNPVDMFCSDSPEIDNPNIYVAYVDMGDPDAKLKMMYFDNNTYQITNSNFEIGGDQLEYLINPNGTICLAAKVGDFCPGEGTVYFFNYDFTPKCDPITHAGACVTQLLFTPVYDYIVWVSKCNNRVYCLEDNGIEVVSLMECAINFPLCAVYDEDADVYYCEGNSPYYYIYKINPLNFSKEEHLYLHQTKLERMLFNTNDNFTYGYSKTGLYKFDDESMLSFIAFPEDLDYDHFRMDDVIISEAANKIYWPTLVSEGFYDVPGIIEYDCDADAINLYLSPQKSTVATLSIILKNSKLGKKLTYAVEKENLFCANAFSSNALFATTHAETRTLTGNWNWISFPCMPRLGNDAYSSQALLENLDPFPSYIELLTSVEGSSYSLIFEDQIWHTQQIPTLISIQGYKYYSSSSVVQSLPVYGTVLDPTTPVPLNAAYENWIGYFLEYPLPPEDAFAGVWNKLTRISTEHWTLVLKDGVIVQGPSLDSPIRYGDGLIVTVKENCTLIWNNDASPGTPVDYPATDYYTYTKKADYVPFYFEMDSTVGIQEIALMVADSCVGAAVVRPGDSITEVNAYLAGIPSGEPITVETWSGFKSARLGSNDYSVVDRITRKRVSRTIYTGEQQPYYVISFNAGESAHGDAVVMLQPPSPNPFSRSVMCSFVLNEASNVTLSVYDLQGQLLNTLMQGNYGEGYYEAAWNGITHTGKTAPNGIYIIRLTANDKMIANEKVVLIR
ncbi:MAG: T9SS type A sorting domain-containing protein, partial [Clostridia bacterium]|nr:T9SS type A sorting domain-containing protein [Clostridia bacterium]